MAHIVFYGFGKAGNRSVSLWQANGGMLPQEGPPRKQLYQAGRIHCGDAALCIAEETDPAVARGVKQLE